MEKTTKKRKKKSKSLKKTLGILVVGGLSFVLTVCLSVGATLAWFAGDTWSSKVMYMGGPVYVEMAGSGVSGATAGSDEAAKWAGGQGQLNMAAAMRQTGTAKNQYDSTGADKSSGFNQDNILLPGQKLLVYSQARVYSTAYYDNLSANEYNAQGSGDNTTNTMGGRYVYTDQSGRVKTTTTSVLRARFSINVEFDPTNGFNNFTDKTFADGYPVQSKPYTGDGHQDEGDGDAWDDALDGSEISVEVTPGDGGGTADKKTYSGRRDAVANGGVWTKDTETEDILKAIKAGTKKSIYKWKFVSESEYNSATGGANGYSKMAKPFDGTINSRGENSAKASGTGNGFYGVWVLDDGGSKSESDAFYKARCNAYLGSYEEHYVDSYGRELKLNIAQQLTSLEDALNNSFVKLVNEASDHILAGEVKGFKTDKNGAITYEKEDTGTNATWLYVDPKIGNDTNAGDSSTSVGGWWYLVESAGTNTVTGGTNEVKTTIDRLVKSEESETPTAGTTYPYTVGEESDDGTPKYDFSTEPEGHNSNGWVNSPVDWSRSVGDDGPQTKTTFTRSEIEDDSNLIKNAKLYEISPKMIVKSGEEPTPEEIGTGTGTVKIASQSFPFVNGNFELPSEEITNVFANAKITFQITFQALQAFFPFTPSIDGIPAGSPLAGMGKALNIGNAIPIFNEAFNYLATINTFDNRGE